MARHCDDSCKLLKFVPEGEVCPIEQLKQKRKQGEWYVEVGEKDDRLYPECEDKVVRVTKKKRRLL